MPASSSSTTSATRTAGLDTAGLALSTQATSTILKTVYTRIGSLAMLCQLSGALSPDQEELGLEASLPREFFAWLVALSVLVISSWGK